MAILLTFLNILQVLLKKVCSSYKTSVLAVARLLILMKTTALWLFLSMVGGGGEEKNQNAANVSSSSSPHMELSVGSDLF